MPHLAFVVTASGEDKSSLPVSEAIGECANIVAPIFEKELSESMRFLVLPLTTIDHSRGLDDPRAPGFPYRFSAAPRLEFFEFPHLFLDVVADFRLYFGLEVFIGGPG